MADARTIRGKRSRSINCCAIPRVLRSAVRCRPRLASALEPVNRMKFMEADMAGYAETIGLETRPATAWNYHDGNTIILSHLIRDAAGGNPADVLRFARAELFAPLGMRHVTLEFDASRHAGRIEPDAGERARLGAVRPALSQRRRGRRKAHPAGGLGELFGVADAERMGRLWRRLLDQSRRQFWREIPDRAWLAARRLLRQGHHRAICDRDSVASGW